jgi:hypothetical protein
MLKEKQDNFLIQSLNRRGKRRKDLAIGNHEIPSE